MVGHLGGSCPGVVGGIFLKCYILKNQPEDYRQCGRMAEAKANLQEMLRVIDEAETWDEELFQYRKEAVETIAILEGRRVVVQATPLDDLEAFLQAHESQSGADSQKCSELILSARQKMSEHKHHEAAMALEEATYFAAETAIEAEIVPLFLSLFLTPIEPAVVEAIVVLAQRCCPQSSRIDAEARRLKHFYG